MSDTTIARLFVVSGMVQGVGYRYFVRSAAQQLGVRGYAKNLTDGRVEIYSIGTPEALAMLRAELARGPRSAIVENIEEDDHALDPQYADNFTIEHDDW